MSLENSTFKTSRVLDNEIIKASDFEFAFEQLVENVSKATQMLLESNQDFVINGKVLPAGGMNVSVSPIYGVCKTSDGGKPFGRTEETDETIGFEGSESGRVDIIEVQGDWQTYDNQQRAFNDPDTDVQTYQYVDTKRLMKPVYQVKKGVEGSETAPEHDTGWVKLAEVKIRAGVTVIASTDIKNITADVAGMDNDDWTNEKDITYNIGYISDVNARFRVQHNEDGTHADDSINSDSLDIGTGAKQINGNVLPIGGSVSIPNESIASSDSILSVIVKAAAMITTLYNAYLKYGNYSFKGDLSVSSIADENNVLTKPITIHAEGDGTAVIKVDGNAVFSIDVNGKLSTNGYTASSANHIVTKTVTDSLKSLIDALDLRVTAIENTADATVYANGVISSGSTGRFNPDSTSIFAATTTNITLSGSQTIDGTTPTDGVTILVKNQTDATENGFYQYSSNSAWSRTNGFLSPESLKSKLFTVSGGTVNGNKMFYVPRVNFTDPSSFGTDDIEFLEYFGAVKAVANKVIIRDANGRAQVAAPSASYDIAVKKNIDDLYGNVTPSALGTAAVGTCTTFARSDHIHAMPRTDQILDAATSTVAANAVCRKVIANNSISGVGYVTRVAIGLQRSTTGWGTALLSVGTNDAGTTFYDYKFSNTGVLTAACFCGTATSATNANNADYICRRQTGNTNNDYHVLLGYTNTGVTCTGLYVANQSTMTFNPSTGDFKVGSVRVSGTTFGCQLVTTRSGSANSASVTFCNCTGLLGFLAASTKDTRFVRYNAAATTAYTILDTSSAVTVAQGGTGATDTATARTNLGLGTAATVNTGTAANCIPTIGTALGTTNNNIVVTDTAGKLKPSGTVLGTAAGCAATDFRSNTWYPDSLTIGCVCNAACAIRATRFGTCYSVDTQCTWLCWCYCCTSGSCRFGRLYIYNCANDLVYAMLETACMSTVQDRLLAQYGIRAGVPIRIAAKSYLQLKAVNGCCLFGANDFPTSNQKYYLDSRSVLTTN